MGIKQLKFLGWAVGAIALVIVVAGVMRGCGPEPEHDYTSQRTIDSLLRVVARQESRKVYYQGQAEAAYKRGLDAQKGKVIIRTIYRNDLKANRALNKHLKDSIIKATFALDPTMDESMFSEDVANGVLDLKSENKALRADDEIDSLTIGELKVAYHAKDSALLACDSAKQAGHDLTRLAAKDVAQAKKEALKQARMKWVGIGAAAGGLVAPVGVPIGAGAGWIVGRFVKKK